MLNVEITYTDGNATKVSMPFKKHGSREEIEIVLLNRYSIPQNQVWKTDVSANSDDEALSALISKVDWAYLYDQGGHDIAIITNLPSVEDQIKVMWLHINQDMTIETADSATKTGVCTIWESDKELFNFWKEKHSVSDYLSELIREDDALDYAYLGRAILADGKVLTLNW